MNSTLVEKAALFLYNSSDFKDRNRILKVLQRNTGKVQDLINFEVIPEEISLRTPNRSEVIYKKISEVVDNERISMLNLFESYYNKQKVYGRLCKLFHVKNNLKNRKKLHSYWRRNFGKFYCRPTSEGKQNLGHLDNMWNQLSNYSDDSTNCDEYFMGITEPSDRNGNSKDPSFADLNDRDPEYFADIVK